MRGHAWTAHASRSIIRIKPKLGNRRFRLIECNYCSRTHLKFPCSHTVYTTLLKLKDLEGSTHVFSQVRIFFIAVISLATASTQFPCKFPVVSTRAAAAILKQCQVPRHPQMASSHVNHYRRRLVAQANAKACSICYRPTDCVLMSIDSKDFFYCCPVHLQDKGFAVPIVDAAEQERLKQAEIAKVKAEYEERQKRKAEEKAEKEKAAATKDVKTKSNSSWLSNPFAASKKEEKPKTPEPTVAPTPEPKEFALHRTLYQHRINLKLQAAQQKARDLQWSTIQFPSAPTK